MTIGIVEEEREAKIMKIRDGFIMRNVAGKNIVVSVGAEINFSGMLTLNDTGVFFWGLLAKGTDKDKMLAAVMAEYDVDKDTASADIDNFIKKLKDHDILED